jgi:cytochrome c oxidase subunit III
MGRELSRPPTLDISGLPTVVFGNRSLMWWGTWMMAATELTVFGGLALSYFYLRTRSTDWPPGVLPPYPLYGTLLTLLFLVSLLPNHWIKKASKAGELKKVQTGLVIMVVFGVAALILRAFEFRSLNIRWDANAYGSITWAIMAFHTFHLITDFADTVVLTVLMFTSLVEGKRFMDCYENSDYWYFVIFTWIPLYLIVYWAPYAL